jgi:DNA-binding protein H-NS
MKTYLSIKTEIAKLEKQAEGVRKAEIAGVVARIREAIAAYGLTATDLGFGRPSSKATVGKKHKDKLPAAATSTGVAKYRDPATGKTWTGRGKPPNWIVGVKDRDAFLIAGATSAATRKAKKMPAVTRRRAKASPATKTPAVQIESGAAAA